jgi:CHAT domain-containing protein
MIAKLGGIRAAAAAAEAAPARILAVLVLLATWSSSAGAVTWIEQVESMLTCTGAASAEERAQLNAPFIPDARNPQAVKNYLQGPPLNERHARFRHLLMLAATAWWADRVNDQHLRGDAYAAIFQLALGYADANPGDILFRQISRCAQSQLFSVMLELGEVAAADQFAGILVTVYSRGLTGQSVEDWPLLLTLREAVLEPRAQQSTTILLRTAQALAAADTMASQPLRASRLFAAAARGSFATGRHDDARNLAMQSLVITGQPAAPEASWRAFPVLYDVFELGDGADAAARLMPLLGTPAVPPPTLHDQGAAFEALERASRAAWSLDENELGGALGLAALRQLADGSTPLVLSHAFLRHGWDRLEEQRDVDWALLARHDQAFGTRTAASYIAGYDTMLRQAQQQFVADAAEQRFFQHKINTALDVLTALYPALPGSREQIEDITFRFAQLRSFGRLTLATLAAEVGRYDVNPKNRFQVERFFTMSTQTSTWIRSLLQDLLVTDPGHPDQAKARWNAFFILGVFFHETAHEFAEIAAFVRKELPSVAELVTPRPLPVTNYQQLLAPDEALVATLVTSRDLYVWSITRRGVALARTRIPERDVEALVQRLRAGLTPASSGGRTTLPDFDAAAAHELYRLVFAPVAASLAGVEHVIWFGHGALGAVPPAVLVTEPPPQPSLRRPEEFGATRFMVDRFAFSALADLSLFPVHRNAPASADHPRNFLGVGAPMLDAAQVAAGGRSKSYDLAGGMDGRALAELPLLAESVDEMRALAAILGEAGSTLWLGPDAVEERFKGDALRGYRVVALATHGFLAYEVKNVPEPSLMLALALDRKDRYDGLLTTREIAALQMDAELVILSACNTAAADGRPRAETFTGLTQAFFTAGARSLMASHWPVMSGAAVHLSVSTVDGASAQGKSLATSLQHAMQAARRDGAANDMEAHPSYWGPFVIVGDGRRTLAR